MRRLLPLLVAVACLLGHGTATAAWTVGAAGEARAVADVLQPPTGLGAALACTPTYTAGTVTSTISYRTSSIATGPGTVTVSRPAGVQPGDVLVASYVVQSGTAPTAPDASWTSRGSIAHPTVGSLLVAGYTRTATAGDPVSWTWTSTTTASAVVSVSAYSGVDTASPVNQVSGGVGTGTAVLAPDVPAVAAGARLMGIFGIRGEGALSPPASMSARSSATSVSSGVGPAAAGLLVADEPWPTASSPGTRTATSTVGGDNIGALLALRPATTSVASTITLQSATSNEGAASLALTIPATVAAGDLLLLGYGKRSSSGTTVTTPTGWTTLRAPEGVANAYLQAVYWKLATAADAGAPLSVTSNDSGASVGVLAVYRGVDQTTPVLGSTGQPAPSTASIVAPSLTPARPNARLVGLFGVQGTSAVPALPTGMSAVSSAAAAGGPPGGRAALRVADEGWATSTATGSRTASTASGNVVGQLVALRPVSYPSIDLTWTPTASTYADGYALALYRDGTLVGTSEPGPASATTTTTGTLVNGASYLLELRSRASAWRSAASATTVATGC